MRRWLTRRGHLGACCCGRRDADSSPAAAHRRWRRACSVDKLMVPKEQRAYHAHAPERSTACRCRLPRYHTRIHDRQISRPCTAQLGCLCHSAMEASLSSHHEHMPASNQQPPRCPKPPIAQMPPSWLHGWCPR
ncbi:hypothetical protein P171DRAFT_30920 [Karstenula rhodostoma CBS 690.94]|uniref:Uncharacterized protein n=1 Tax=Karstenula rhodostoma CBS 690.94 TaxID=1392251 RepID=A0A9P4PJZ5_9PLEO|nr:hypothetical protein P171DRAFT_30920 [Karstenula rhodostoma CBS 690.94]